MRKKMRIIVTGASGFIGRNFLLAAPRTWKINALYNTHSDFPSFVKKHKLRNVKAVRCDLSSEASAAKVLSKLGSFDTCLYLAGNTDPQLSVKRPLFDMKSNLVSLANFFAHFRGRRLVFFSSGAVYDGLTGKVSPKSIINPRLPYAISKHSCELYLKIYKNVGTFSDYAVVRFFGAYGPYEPERKIYSRLVKAFSFNGKNSYEVYGDGTNLIDAMYVGDAVKGIMRVLKSRKRNVTVDFCAGKPVSINQLVALAGKTFGVKAIIKHRGVSHEPIRFRASPKEFKRIYGFQPATSLGKGLVLLKRHLGEISAK